MDDDTEGVGESTCLPAAADRGASSSAGGGSHGYTDIEKEVFDRLVEKGIPEVVENQPAFREQLHRHFERLPLSYAIDVNVDKAEDVLLHRRILNDCADPEKRPIFHVRFLHCAPASVDSQDNTQGLSTSENGNGGGSQASTLRGSEPTEFEPCEGMEDLSLTGKKVVDDSEASSSRSVSTSV